MIFAKTNFNDLNVIRGLCALANIFGKMVGMLFKICIFQQMIFSIHKMRKYFALT